jgi:ketosteroid isomerase-like protein
MTRDQLQGWLERYLEAWRSYDREQIADLFALDVEYRFHPYDPPVTGRDAVVEAWLGEGDHEGAPDRDEPGTWEAEYRPFAVDGDTAVATGQSSYRNEPGGEVYRTYFNCFVMRFDDDGRCREFTEWFMFRPEDVQP